MSFVTVSPNVMVKHINHSERIYSNTEVSVCVPLNDDNKNHCMYRSVIKVSTHPASGE